jgi:hypothetical protein
VGREGARRREELEDRRKWRTEGNQRRKSRKSRREVEEGNKLRPEGMK